MKLILVVTAVVAVSTSSPGAPTAAGGAESPRLVEGLGTASIEPDTSSPQARAWFQQGERLVWAFDEVEAARAFREAQRLDPKCALCFWGEAWALKPTINLRLRLEEAPVARVAAIKAQAIGGGLGARDKLLVDSMVQATRGPLFAGRAYAAALEAVASRFAGDPVPAILAAEAQMSFTDWRGFEPGSNAQRLLERALQQSPDHSGAIHLYIHLTDWIERPDLAERHADRLAAIAPAASHLQHMPAHAYFGVGRYADAMAANRAAVATHRSFLAKAAPAPSANRERLLDHSNYFGVFSALAAGEEVEARRFLGALRSAASAGSHSEMQHRMLSIASAYVDAVHGRPQNILERAELPPDQKFERVLRHYVRGEAVARTGDADATAGEAEALSLIRSEPQTQALERRELRLAELYEQVLRGRAAMLSGEHAAAVDAFRAAAEAQFGTRMSNDPPDYWYSTLRSLAEALLAAGDAIGAAEQARLSLKEWPNDPRAAVVLTKASVLADSSP